ncbi:MAG: hypothetical protein WBR24_07170 [Desulfobacterales bacterium]
MRRGATGNVTQLTAGFTRCMHSIQSIDRRYFKHLFDRTVWFQIF